MSKKEKPKKDKPIHDQVSRVVKFITDTQRDTDRKLLELASICKDKECRVK